jgi:hypothetical protein
VDEGEGCCCCCGERGVRKRRGEGCRLRERERAERKCEPLNPKFFLYICG